MTTTDDRTLDAPPERDRLDAGGHKLAAANAQTAARFAERWRDGQIGAAARVIRQHAEALETGKLPPADRDKVADFFSRADRNDERAKRYRAASEHHLRAAVKAEPRIYDRESPHSFWRDRGLAAMPGHPLHREALGRLERHVREVAVEIRQGSPEGRAALAQLANNTREHAVERAAELRSAMTSGAASGGSFVTPAWLQNLWATYRSPLRSFTQQCSPVPAPDYGLEVIIPVFNSPTTVGEQTAENAGVDSSTPTAATLTATMVPLVGEVPVSQQLFDRGGPMKFDEIITAQLKEQLDAAVNAYVLGQALATAQTVTDATTLSIATFYADLSSAREKLTDAAGTRVAGTHVFTTSDFAGWATKQVDKQTRPIVVPDAGALVAVSDDPAWQGFMGLVLPGNLRWFADDQIPTTSTHTQVIVSKPATIAVVETEPIAFAYEETFATTLTVVCGVRAYVAAVPRYPTAVAAISGAGYPTTLK
ncbi:MAG TPA: hypothetical protein VND62_11305 [Acidimicrobiales bacterium]|nr:hypothetical protein [Acidimicrobiales bacterium]